MSWRTRLQWAEAACRDCGCGIGRASHGRITDACTCHDTIVHKRPATALKTLPTVALLIMSVPIIPVAPLPLPSELDTTRKSFAPMLRAGDAARKNSLTAKTQTRAERRIR